MAIIFINGSGNNKAANCHVLQILFDLNCRDSLDVAFPYIGRSGGGLYKGVVVMTHPGQKIGKSGISSFKSN